MFAFDFKFISADIDLTRTKIFVTVIEPLHRRGGGGRGRCLQGNLWYSPPASMTSRLASVTFKMASKVLIEETDKNFDFITKYCSDFLDCEMSSGVMNFKDSFLSTSKFYGQLYRPVTLLRASTQLD